jgi:hypothetical protein
MICIVHVQRHFTMGKWFAWCESHGRVAAKGGHAKTQTSALCDESEALRRGALHAPQS